jgi:hypothetical protein
MAQQNHEPFPARSPAPYRDTGSIFPEDDANLFAAYQSYSSWQLKLHIPLKNVDPKANSPYGLMRRATEAKVDIWIQTDNSEGFLLLESYPIRYLYAFAPGMRKFAAGLKRSGTDELILKKGWVDAEIFRQIALWIEEHCKNPTDALSILAVDIQTQLVALKWYTTVDSLDLDVAASAELAEFITQTTT